MQFEVRKQQRSSLPQKTIIVYMLNLLSIFRSQDNYEKMIDRYF